MKIGFNLLLWTINVEDRHMPIIEDLKKTGYDGVEVPVFGGETAQFQALGRRLSDMGLERTAVSALTSTDVNPLVPDAAVRAKAVDFMKGVLDGCAALGATRVVGPMHSVLGHFSGSGPTEDERKRCVEFHHKVGDHAKSVGVIVNLEALNRFECYFLNTMQQLADYLDEVDHPAIKGMYDTFHANIEEKDPVAAIKAIKKHMIHVHISENDRGTPGKGHVPWAATYKALRAAKYDGWMTSEAFGRALPALAAATRVWRDFFPSQDSVYLEGIKQMKAGWARAK